MSEPSKKVALPAYLVRRCEAFRITKGAEHSYVIRDKVQNKTWDFDPWQFFILEVLPGCESIEKLQSVFQDRFNRLISRDELEEFFASIADRRLFDETALQHPLLSVFAHKTYDVVDGKAVPKAYTSLFGRSDGSAAPALEPKAEATAEAAPEEEVLPAGVQDVPGADRRTMEKMIDLFDPRPMLRVVAPMLASLRYAMYAFPALLVVSLLLLAGHWQYFMADLGQLHLKVSLGGHLLFSLLTVNLASVILRACVAHSYGAQVERIGIMFFVGFVPRFEVGIRHLDKLSRVQRMWYHGGNLILRGLLLSIGILMWFFTIDSAGGIGNQFALMLILTCWGSLVIETGNPFVRASTYFLLCAYLDEPKLRAKAQKALMNKIHGSVYQASDSNILAIYGLACTAYVTLLTVFLTLGLGHWLWRDLHIGMTAFAIAAAICGFVLWRNYKTLKKYGEIYHRTQQFDRWRSRTLITEDQAATEVQVQKKHYWRYAALLGVLLLLLLPYSYDISGAVQIYPLNKQVISTDTPGLIKNVYFDGGETIKKGTVIATLEHDDYAAKVTVADADIEAQKAVVADLKSRPKPEEIRVAEEDLRVAQTQAQFSREKVPRMENLYRQGAVPLEELETARKQADTDARQVDQKQAALALAKTGPTKDEIAAAEAKLSSLQAEKALYQGKLARTTLRMPFDGNILTLHLKDRVNSYLDQGAPFAAVEYTGAVTAQIDIDEADLQYVKIGSKVRLHPTAFFDRQFEGVVTQIDRNVTTKPSGTYAAVIATFQNPDGALKTGMTGEAKIDGEVMPVWSAFTQSIQHFFKVEVWSWIP
ncbi:MAG TPA: efflux RND transporter periplasmic adaptor subunit [Rhodanobacteraceae bacterium]